MSSRDQDRRAGDADAGHDRAEGQRRAEHGLGGIPAYSDLQAAYKKVA